jgi:hypothetical protein
MVTFVQVFQPKYCMLKISATNYNVNSSETVELDKLCVNMAGMVTKM